MTVQIRKIAKNQVNMVSNSQAIFKDIFYINHKVTSSNESLNCAMTWLKKAQDANSDGGVAAGYSLIYGWLPSYPETTGYIIPTFINYCNIIKQEEYLNRAIRMATWLLSVQYSDGSIKGHFGKKDSKPVIFDTGQVLQGFTSIYTATRDKQFLDAAVKAADWLVDAQEPDGSWRQFEIFNTPHVYNTRVAWPLIEIGRLISNEHYIKSGAANIEWALKNQTNNGWFKNNAFRVKNQPILHTIAYAIEGILESSILMKNEKWRDAAKKPVEVLLQLLELNGVFSGGYDAEWKPITGSRCLTGEAQLSICLQKLYQITNESRFRDTAIKINHSLKPLQDITSRNEGIKGSIKGSHPIWGAYEPFSYLNWATKFFADALMLEKYPIIR